MKIDLNAAVSSQIVAERSVKQVTNDGQVSGQTSGQMSGPISGTSSGQVQVGDRATISSASASVQSLTQQALKSPEVRQDKVDTLRQAINSGQYQVDPAKIASAIAESKAK